MVMATRWGAVVTTAAAVSMVCVAGIMIHRRYRNRRPPPPAVWDKTVQGWMLQPYTRVPHSISVTLNNRNISIVRCMVPDNRSFLAIADGVFTVDECNGFIKRLEEREKWGIPAINVNGTMVYAEEHRLKITTANAMALSAPADADLLDPMGAFFGVGSQYVGIAKRYEASMAIPVPTTTSSSSSGAPDHADGGVTIHYDDCKTTALLYLNEVEVGGETVFPKCNIEIKPKAGRVVIFVSVRRSCPDGHNCMEWDPYMAHFARRVLQGRKYIAQFMSVGGHCHLPNRARLL